MAKKRAETAPNPPRGRPSKQSDELKQEIIERISNGEPLEVICRDAHMPHSSTVRNWQAEDGAFSLAIARARDDGHEHLAYRTRRVAAGEAGYSSGDVQRDKLMIWTDFNLLSKWNPKKYGDKVALEHSGSIENLTDEQLTARINALSAQQNIKA